MTKVSEIITINWSAVLQGITTGVVGALVFWIFGLLRESIRNGWLRRSIRQQLSPVTCGSGIHGVNTSIRNHLQKSFRVRAVSLVTAKGNFAFNATGTVSSSFPPKRVKLTTEQKERLKSGKEVMIDSPAISHRSWSVKHEHAGFVEVQPFTSQEFILPLALMDTVDDEVRHLQITVEYETWTKRTRILHQCTQGWAVEHLRKQIAHTKAELQSGSLNAARAMFQLPPVKYQPRLSSASAEPPTTGSSHQASC